MDAEVLRISSSLRQRTLTAFVLGPLVIAAVLWLPTPAFALFFGVVVLGAGWEWCGLAGIDGVARRLVYLGLIAVCLGLLWPHADWRLWLIGISIPWWAFQSARMLRMREIEPSPGFQPLLLPVGLLVLVAPWAALIDLHRIPHVGPALVLFLMVVIWTADSLAYFVGRRWGRTKLAPAVSPGKTLAGVYGGVVGAALCGLLFAWHQSLGFGATLLVLLVCGGSALISVVGDLYESFLKRRRGVKDSSQLLPGHGGLLDRIDSLTAAAPLFALGMTWALM
ncbi:phosphatidate cytidylyltransferase [Thiorhodococcus drewsii AZ1]|uniref:Phosphatidate cytidylyltransferase n=1 Tax=Thiorhodococcus drewsii AZ1 TaxID=765913 RepID=G2E5H2_9GAMM|nr:phosphatidate cytidylyltransferase [Thiorhodococcus drewsii]EGV28757.1 phosphatidate cytidylyltransferase [Thiorhodococcus drewsii AZ1]